MKLRRLPSTEFSVIVGTIVCFIHAFFFDADVGNVTHHGLGTERSVGTVRGE